METALFYLLAGIIGGFCSSAPIGPINLWVANLTLLHREKELPPYLLGVVVCDALYASLAAWGYYKWLQAGPLYTGFSFIGGAFLIILGAFGLFAKPSQGGTAHTPGSQWTKRFGFGFVMTGSNPAFLMFWVAAIDFINSIYDSSPSRWALAAFVIGIVIGDGVWFRCLAVLVKRGRSFLTNGFLVRFRQGIAVAFIILGVVAILRNL